MQKIRIAVVGLGYVGMPLAIELSKNFFTIGFDINKKRINELKNCIDRTKENKITKKLLSKLEITSKLEKISKCNVYIVTVPTPIFTNKKPNLIPLSNALNDLNKIIKKKDLIIIESTVYPGATEELIKKYINKKFVLNRDYHIGFCPERINPGDRKHKITNINKVISGSSNYARKTAFLIYSKITNSKVYIAQNIKTAEAAKIIENTQRDLNVALINELSLICTKLNINTHKVLEAANTKWNFMKFEPGLVGGHCIGVDPYYLTYKAKKIGVNPKVILAGRKINDSMPKKIVNNIFLNLKKKKIQLNKLKTVILGYTFKENCSDIRNSKVKNLFKEIKKKVNDVKIYDPLVDLSNVDNKTRSFFLKNLDNNKYDLMIFAVKHKYFLKNKANILKKNSKKNTYFVDLKNILKNNNADYTL